MEYLHEGIPLLNNENNQIQVFYSRVNLESLNEAIPSIKYSIDTHAICKISAYVLMENLPSIK